MKKYASLLLIGSLAALASCGENKEESTQAQIDSAVEARTAEMEARMNAHNDSMITAMAAIRADSTRIADSISHSVTTTKTTTTVTKKPSGTKTSTKTTTTTKSDGTKVTDRPGAVDVNVNNQDEKPKPVSDRPGATQTVPNK